LVEDISPDKSKSKCVGYGTPYYLAQEIIKGEKFII
jgi:hypothetical protein